MLADVALAAAVAATDINFDANAAELDAALCQWDAILAWLIGWLIAYAFVFVHAVCVCFRLSV